jgi:hypothetical protein
MNNEKCAERNTRREHGVKNAKSKERNNAKCAKENARRERRVKCREHGEE